MAKHEGWANYETWAAALWLDNDQGTQEYWREIIAEEILGDAGRDISRMGAKIKPARKLVIRDELAERLKDWHEAMAFDSVDDGGLGFGDKGVFTDLLTASLGEVDWTEIAEHMLEGTVEGLKYSSGRR